MNAGFRNDIPLGYVQQVGVVAAVTVASLFSGGVIPPGTAKLVISTETQSIRWRDDGTAPTAAVGMPLAVGSTLVYEGNVARLQIIQTAASATVNIAAYG